jgi:alpha-glucosidase
MNYDAFMEPLTWYLTGMEKHSDEFRPYMLGNAQFFVEAMKHHMTHMLTPSLMVAMNEISNHDHSRFLTRTNHKAGRVQTLGYDAAGENINEAVMREAVVMQMTWIGAPTVYYGDEAGVVGFTDPDNRRTYPWGKENKQLLEFHKEAIRMHKESEALRYGSLEILGAKCSMVIYGRFTENEKVVVVVNSSESQGTVKVPVWRLEVPMEATMTQLLYSYQDGYSTRKGEYQVKDGNVLLQMDKHSAIVLQYKK